MLPIEIEALSKIFRGKKRQRVMALNEVSFTVQQGEVCGFLGPNGAGKSTTIKVLLGQIGPTSGSAMLFGQNCSSAGARKHVGYLPENPAFYDYLTAREYLELVGRMFNMSRHDIVRETERVLELLSLKGASNRPIRGYSKGMVQRLGLAQTLLHDPDLYILDEPMSGLDPIGRSLVKEIIVDLKQKGKTVFFSTHVTSDVEAVCDRVGVIVDGKLRTFSSVEDIMEQGLEGYRIQLAESSTAHWLGFSCHEKGSGVVEVYVPRQQMTSFMMKIGSSVAQVRLIEPKRKDLEAFFLDIVKQSSL